MTTTVTDRTSRRIRRASARVGVLQVVSSTARRGAEIFGADLGDALAERGRPIRTVALTAGAHGGGLPMRTLGRRALGPATLLALRREIKRNRIVVAHGSSAVVACALACVASGTPFVYRNIGDPRYWLDNRRRQRRMRWILRRARTVVALWEGSANELRTVAGRDLDIRVIPKGVPASRFPPIGRADRSASRALWGIDPDAIVGVYIGSLSHEKNVDALIDAVATVPNVFLLVVGTGSDRERLEARAEERAPGRVRFTGSLERPADALAAADVLLLPSRTEGIPGVLIEAAFSELPVVATAVGGVAEIVAHGETGILIHDAEAPSIGGAIRSAVARGTEMGRAGRRRCLERFEIGVIADRWDDLLSELGAWERT